MRVGRWAEVALAQREVFGRVLAGVQWRYRRRFRGVQHHERQHGDYSGALRGCCLFGGAGEGLLSIGKRFRQIGVAQATEGPTSVLGVSESTTRDWYFPLRRRPAEVISPSMHAIRLLGVTARAVTPPAVTGVLMKGVSGWSVVRVPDSALVPGFEFFAFRRDVLRHTARA